MSRSRPWARHYLDAWSEDAANPELPCWFRVVALAYGHHADNGHARFKRGQLGRILGSVRHGRFEPDRHIYRAIDIAVSYGLLESGSYWGCLIVPGHKIRMGDLGAAARPCPLEPTHKAHR